jgi:hypothetical protein
MPAPFTIITAIASAPTILKFAHDSVEFYSKLKSLKSAMPPRPLSSSENLTKFEKAQVGEMYAALEAARTVACDIAARALRHYMFIAGGLTALVIVGSIVLMIIPLPLWMFTLLAVMLVLGLAGLSLVPQGSPMFRSWTPAR